MKEIDVQPQEVQSPKQEEPKEAHTRPIIIKMPKIKDKGRILKAARKKQLVTYKGASIRLSADFSTETAGQKRLVQYIQSVEK